MPTLPANLISLLQSARVLVVGDTMLDRYWFGEVERISPEAPVPVAKIGRMDQRAGGAGNVARNIAALGGRAGLLSIVGEDEAANELEKIVQSSGVQTFLEHDETIATTVKLRVLSRNQQLLRIDFEEKPSQDVLERLNRRFRSLLPDYDAVILSDYGKGCLFQVADMIDFAREHNKPVLIDPKGDDYEKYAGAYLITPNRNELRQVVGSWGNEAELTEKAEALLPSAAGDIVSSGKGKIKFYSTHERWFGMTYPEDKAIVKAEIAKKIEAGYYPDKLWEK